VGTRPQQTGFGPTQTNLLFGPKHPFNQKEDAENPLKCRQNLNQFIVMKKTKLLSLFSLLLMFFSIGSYAQELQTQTITPSTQNGDGGYTWNPEGGCEGIAPTGNIVAK